MKQNKNGSQFSMDPGLGEKYLEKGSRSINPDGSFNIKRSGSGFHYKDLYQYLINISWTKFFLLTLLGYVIANVSFAAIYFVIGENNLIGTHDGSSKKSFLDGLFFSVQTLTTVGYGGIIPRGVLTNVVAALEAMTGLLGFALITGLLYGRFSKPSARILYSKNLIVTPGEKNYSLMFRIANQRNTNIMEIEARVLFSYIDFSSKEQIRRYIALNLERSSVYLFPTNWTIVHSIDDESPMFGKTLNELKEMHAEFLILIKGFDDTFSQVVHSRYSYNYEDIVWNAKFIKAYSTDESGSVVFHLPDIHKYELVSK